ncbi:MAG: integration host factor subunit beta [Acidobacteriia bacterium]|nr:integration host factor subunit beta [Terriglobia bacterium]
MTKQQLIDTVAAATERTRAEVETIVDSLLGEIGKALRSGERVDLRGFGSFSVKDKKARQGRNPKTGETIQIAARRAATFKPSKELSDRLATESSVTTGHA